MGDASSSSVVTPGATAAPVERQHLGRHPSGHADAGDHVRRLDHGLVPAHGLARAVVARRHDVVGYVRMGLTCAG